MKNNDVKSMIGEIARLQVKTEQLKKKQALIDMKVFLATQPGPWLDLDGNLQPDERRLRVKLAENLASPGVRAWCEERGYKVADLVDANANMSRVEFATLIDGGWLPKKEKSFESLRTPK